MNAMKKIGLALLSIAGLTGSTFAAAQDWSSVTTAVTTEITAVMPVALGVFGAIVAVVIGKKVLKRIMS